MKKAQDETVPQTEDPTHSATATYEDQDTNEDDDVDQVEANVLIDDVEVSSEENMLEEELPAGSKKRKAGESSSQPGKRVKRKASRPKLSKNLTDDDIDMITIKVGVSTEEALTDFQDRKKQHLADMVQKLVALQDSIAQLRIDPSPSGSQQEQQSK